MSPKNSQTKLSARKRLFAKLRYEDILKDEEIAKQCGIVRRTVYEWDGDPEVQKEMQRLGEADTQKAMRYFQKNAMRAAKATVKLTDVETIKDEAGKAIRQDFIQPGEVVRKAAADILQAQNINVKGLEKESPDVDDLLGSVDNGDIERRAKIIARRARKANKRGSASDRG